MKSLKAVVGSTLLLLAFVPPLSAAIPASERAALIAFYNFTRGDSWTNKSGWKTPPLASDGFAMPGTEWTWNGVVVINDHVTKLNLLINGLGGSIPSDIGNLSALTGINFLGNKIKGAIPGKLASLSNLTYLGLSSNQLSGTIPAALGSLAKLETLDLSDNQLQGQIPGTLGNLVNLKILNLAYNDLSGAIPVEFTNLASLTELKLGSNSFSGSIPAELGGMANLSNLNLSSNQLKGAIPMALTDLKNLEYLALGENGLTGTIPPEIGNMGALKGLGLYGNRLKGAIPPEIGNLVNLTYLGLFWNELSGAIPSELGNLVNLERLDLNRNKLSGSIPTVLGNLTKLICLDFGGNSLSGSIPPELGTLASLVELYLDCNQLSGEIPPELGDLTSLSWLFLYNNRLSGSIPDSLGNLIRLNVLYLNSNQLSGPIPAELGKLTGLHCLFLDSNALSGTIPSSFSNLTNLSSYYDFTIDYNCLFTFDSGLAAFLDPKNDTWSRTQTVAPEDVTARKGSGTDVILSWTKIPYASHTGGYRVFYATNSGGPYTFYGQTSSKKTTSMTVKGLTSGTPCYFMVKTRTDAHGDQQSVLDSDWSNEASIVPGVGTPALPAVTTRDVIGLAIDSASGGGEVISDGGSSVTARGLCWSLFPNPTLADPHTADGSGLGAFSSQLIGLDISSTYYVRAYATTPSGTAYGNRVSFSTPVLERISLGLQATRRKEKAWLASRYYGELQLMVANPGKVSVASYVLMRRTSGGSWETLREFTPTELAGGGLSYNDQGLSSNCSYTYQLKALRVSGSVLARSEEISI
jgi:Leucine-rich repeat (LRR) protein